MKCKARISCSLLFALAALAGCSSEPSAKSKKAEFTLDRVQGKAQVRDESGGSADVTMNAGGPTVYLWKGMQRYRLFLRKKADFVHGNEYIVEGIHAQKAIDEIGDPDLGKNGYPLQDSCTRVVRMAWGSLGMDEIGPTASIVRTMVKRYPARPLFLVTRIQAVPEVVGASKKDAEDKNIREIDVPAEKQRASLIEGPSVQPAPLWEPAGGMVSCKLLINPEGKVSELETGTQLCEAVPWSQFRYQPAVQGGRPVKVRTEVAVRFEPRK